MLMALALIVGGHAHAGDGACLPLLDRDHGWSVRVRSPGTYCMAADLSQSAPPPALLLPHQPVPQSPLLNVVASGVTVDLRGHVLQAKQKLAQGLIVNGSGEAYRESIKVRNGSIRNTDQPAVFMVYTWNSRNPRFSRNSVGGDLAVANSLSEYRRTAFVLEDLTLEASDVAVILQGRGNVIRRCRIVGGNGTVNLYGPGLVFEDNEIVLNAVDTKVDGEPPVALYLEDAADSVVRNNRITVRGSQVAAEAIVLKNSPNVVLQNNAVTGVREDYRLLDQQSSVRAQ
jgi:hypothetical protein